MRRTSARLAQLRRHCERVKWRDKQASEAYYTLLLAQKPGVPGINIVLMAGVLKRYYRNDDARMFTDGPFFAFLRKEMKPAANTLYCYSHPDVPPNHAYLLPLADWLPESEPMKIEEKETPVKYLEDSFSVAAPNTQTYRDNWEATFGEKKTDPEPTPDQKAVRAYLAAGGEPSPIGWYGVIKLDEKEAAIEIGWTCPVCCGADTARVISEIDREARVFQCCPHDGDLSDKSNRVSHLFTDIP